MPQFIFASNNEFKSKTENDLTSMCCRKKKALLEKDQANFFLRRHER